MTKKTTKKVTKKKAVKKVAKKKAAKKVAKKKKVTSKKSPAKCVAVAALPTEAQVVATPAATEDLSSLEESSIV